MSGQYRFSIQYVSQYSVTLGAEQGSRGERTDPGYRGTLARAGNGVPTAGADPRLRARFLRIRRMSAGRLKLGE